MPFVIDPPEPPPVSPPPEEGSQLWEVLFRSLGFHQKADESGDLQRACEALMGPLQRVYDLIRERPGRPKGSTMLDPDNAPAEGLAYLSQYVGARLRPNMSEAQIRAEIKAPSTWRRGQDEIIELVAKRELSEGLESWIRIRPRYPGPGQIYIRTLLSQTPNPERVKQLLEEEGIPAWDVLDYQAITGVTVADVVASTKWTTVADLAAKFSDVDALAHILPDEL